MNGQLEVTVPSKNSEKCSWVISNPRFGTKCRRRDGLDLNCLTLVAIPCFWEEVIFHTGSSTSIALGGLIAGGTRKGDDKLVSCERATFWS